MLTFHGPDVNNSCNIASRVDFVAGGEGEMSGGAQKRETGAYALPLRNCPRPGSPAAKGHDGYLLEGNLSR